MTDLSVLSLDELTAMIPCIDINIHECMRSRTGKLRISGLLKNKARIQSEINSRVIIASHDPELDVVIIEQGNFNQ